MGTLTGFEVEQSNADITAVVDRDGAVTDLPDLADFGIAPTHYDPVTNQNVASVFWDFMTTDDATVFENGAYVEGDLFLEPLYAVGRPRTEAYWAWVKVNDVEQWVLIQCFERRCLTYAPGNPDGWQVESGNIGQHYYNWRYHQIDLDDPVTPEDGSFTFDGESATTIFVEQQVTLTAQVWGTDILGSTQSLADITVRFEIEAGGVAFVSLDRDHDVTGIDGTALVVVTGDAEGVATVNAYADLDGSGDFTDGVDLDLGSVEVTVAVNDNGEENEENDEVQRSQVEPRHPFVD
jgi:hypothetical protein